MLEETSTTLLAHVNKSFPSHLLPLTLIFHANQPYGPHYLIQPTLLQKTLLSYSVVISNSYQIRDLRHGTSTSLPTLCAPYLWLKQSLHNRFRLDQPISRCGTGYTVERRLVLRLAAGYLPQRFCWTSMGVPKQQLRSRRPKHDLRVFQPRQYAGPQPA